MKEKNINSDHSLVTNECASSEVECMNSYVNKSLSTRVTSVENYNNSNNNKICLINKNQSDKSKIDLQISDDVKSFKTFNNDNNKKSKPKLKYCFNEKFTFENNKNDIQNNTFQNSDNQSFEKYDDLNLEFSQINKQITSFENLPIKDISNLNLKKDENLIYNEISKSTSQNFNEILNQKEFQDLRFSFSIIDDFNDKNKAEDENKIATPKKFDYNFSSSNTVVHKEKNKQTPHWKKDKKNFDILKNKTNDIQNFFKDITLNETFKLKKSSTLISIDESFFLRSTSAHVDSQNNKINDFKSDNEYITNSLNNSSSYNQKKKFFIDPDSPLKFFGNDYNTYTKDKMNFLLLKIKAPHINHESLSKDLLGHKKIEHEINSPKINNESDSKVFVDNNHKIELSQNEHNLHNINNNNDLKIFKTKKKLNVNYNHDLKTKNDLKTNENETHKFNSINSKHSLVKNKKTHDCQIKTPREINHKVNSSFELQNNGKKSTLMNDYNLEFLIKKIKNLQSENAFLRHEMNSKLKNVDTNYNNSFETTDCTFNSSKYSHFENDDKEKKKEINSIFMDKYKKNAYFDGKLDMNLRHNNFFDFKNDHTYDLYDNDNSLDVNDDSIMEVKYLKEVEKKKINSGNGIQSKTTKRLLSLISQIISSDDNKQSNLWNTIRFIDLSSCSLKSIINLNEILPNLLRLDISKNQLKNLQGLSIDILNLNASFNKITSSKFFLNLCNLQELNLSNNVLDDISVFKNCIHLSSLNLSNNRLNSLNELKNLTNLYKLDLSNNKIEGSIDFSCFNLRNLQELYLFNNCIDSLENINNLPNLRVLNLDRNNISTFFCSDKHMNLKKLSIRFNKLKYLDLYFFPFLKILKIDNNNLYSVDNLSKLKNLSEFSCKSQNPNFNILSALEAKRIKKLNLSSNSRFNKLDFVSLKKINPFINITHLSLFFVNLKNVPSVFFHLFPNVKFLDLSLNELTNVDNLSNFQNLKKLSLSSNKLTKIENIIKALSKSRFSLLSLDLRFNPLNSILYSNDFEIQKNNRMVQSDHIYLRSDQKESKNLFPFYNKSLKLVSDNDEKEKNYFNNSTNDSYQKKKFKLKYETLLINYFKNLKYLDDVLIQQKKKIKLFESFKFDDI